MIENSKIKFNQKKHFEHTNSSNLYDHDPQSNGLVLGEKGRYHYPSDNLKSDLKNTLAVSTNVNQYLHDIRSNENDTNSSSFLLSNLKRPGRRPVSIPASSEYVPRGKRLVVPPSNQHSTAAIFDNDGREPRISDFPTNKSRYVVSTESDEYNTMTMPVKNTKLLTDQTSSSSSSSSAAGPESHLLTSLGSSQKYNNTSSQHSQAHSGVTSNNNGNNIIAPIKTTTSLTVKLDKMYQEELRQVKALTKKVGKTPSWEERNGLVPPKS